MVAVARDGSKGAVSPISATRKDAYAGLAIRYLPKQWNTSIVRQGRNEASGEFLARQLARMRIPERRLK